MTLKWFHLLGIFLMGGILFFACYPRIENFLVFFPEAELVLEPGDLGLPAHDIFVEVEEGTVIHGWFFAPPDDEAPVLLFCHGNAGNISHRLDNVRHLLGHGMGVLLFDYRGYGKSTGRPSEEGVYKDGLAAYGHLVRELRVPPDRVVPFGRSLGAAVALEVALNQQVRSVILESAFTSTRGMARRMGVFALVSPFIPSNYNNLAKITRLEAHKLIIHGTEDEIVPFKMGEALYEAAPEPKAFLPLYGAGHNDTYVTGGEAYFRALAGFAKTPGALP
jgi:fermentation-respiration switch protein FrsA (DUF1100 family)